MSDWSSALPAVSRLSIVRSPIRGCSNASRKFLPRRREAIRDRNQSGGARLDRGARRKAAPRCGPGGGLRISRGPSITRPNAAPGPCNVTPSIGCLPSLSGARSATSDLTTHVEWTSLAERAEECGLRIAGFTDQHHFLTGLLSSSSRTRFAGAEKSRALQTLIHPEFLGIKFQFLGTGERVSRSRFVRRFQVREGEPPRAGAGLM